MTEGLTGLQFINSACLGRLMAAAEAEATEELTCLLSVNPSLLSQAYQGSLPEESITHRRLSPPSTIISQEYDPHRLPPAGHFYGGIFSIMVRSSQITVACVELTAKQAGHVCYSYYTH